MIPSLPSPNHAIGLPSISYIPPLTIIRKAFPSLPSLPLPSFSVSMAVTISSQNKAQYPWHYTLLPPAIRRPLLSMALAHSSLTNSNQILATIKLVRGTPCPRWHVDKVPLRGLCALHGPGCEVMEHGTVRSLQTGDVVFMRGAGVQNCDKGVLHRSPHVKQEQARLLLQTDDV